MGFLIFIQKIKNRVKETLYIVTNIFENYHDLLKKWCMDILVWIRIYPTIIRTLLISDCDIYLC